MKKDLINKISIIIAVFALSFAFTYNIAIDEGGKLTDDRFFLAFIMLMATMGVMFSFFTSRRSLPVAHNVAILGFPQSGKTTLLTQMFNELLLFRVKGVEATLRGEATINRVSDYIAKINARKAIGATVHDTRFPYTANVKTKKGILSENYKVAYGDFPGEESEQYSKDVAKQNSSFLADREFTHWLVESDTIIFVIDSARLLSELRSSERNSGTAGNTDYSIQMSKTIMADWHHIHETRPSADKKEQPNYILAFTKCDLFDLRGVVENETNPEKEIMLLGFEEPLPEVRKLNPETFEIVSKECLNEFKDLIDFMKGRNRNFEIIFTSSFGLMKDRRVGLEELFNASIPKG